jgi:hypothetical protein
MSRRLGFCGPSAIPIRIPNTNRSYSYPLAIALQPAKLCKLSQKVQRLEPVYRSLGRVERIGVNAVVKDEIDMAG